MIICSYDLFPAAMLLTPAAIIIVIALTLATAPVLMSSHQEAPA